MQFYSQNYFDLICAGLGHTVVTDSMNTAMSLDDGLRIMSERVNHIADYQNGLIFFCGNGASASMAEHMSHDWFQNGRVNTTTCAEVSHITAISNDLSYEDVFAFRAERILSEKDIFVGISSSGNSMNILKASKKAKEKGAFCVTLSGKSQDNQLRKLGDLNFYVPLDTYGEVESAHAVLLHTILDYYMDQYLGGRH